MHTPQLKETYAHATAEGDEYLMGLCTPLSLIAPAQIHNHKRRHKSLAHPGQQSCAKRSFRNRMHFIPVCSAVSVRCYQDTPGRNNDRTGTVSKNGAERRDVSILKKSVPW